MSGNLSALYLWDSLDKNILQRNADLIENFSQQAIKAGVIENCKRHLGFSHIASQSVSIVKHPLLGIDGAAIVAQFKKYPETQDNNFYQIAGMARLIQVEKEILPVVLIFPNANKTTLEHECVHLCQWLNNQTYQLTLNERKSIFQQNVEIVIKNVLSTSSEQALDLLIRSTCYKVWMELEAHYCTYDKSTISQYEILDLAQRSSQPFATFEGGIYEWGIDKGIPNAIDICREKFTYFCNELESQVEWVTNLVANSGSKTLHEALWWCKEDFEAEMMFGEFDDM